MLPHHLTIILPLLLVPILASASPTDPYDSPTTRVPDVTPSTELNLCPCTNTTTAGPMHQNKMPNTLIHGMTCLCHAGPAQGTTIRDDYRYSPGIGAHKLHTRAATWNEARKMCNEEGGHLAILNSLSEAHVSIDFCRFELSYTYVMMCVF